MHPALRWLPAVTSAVVASLVAAPLRRFLAEDVCHDRGGRVVREVAQCTFSADYSVALASFPGPASGVYLVLGVLLFLGGGTTLLLMRRDRRRHPAASA